MAKKKTSQAESLAFEEALAQLQEIVQQLEDGTLGLDEALTRYQEGTGLLKHCYQVLTQAEQKIELLTGFDEAGNAECEPFDSSATLDQREQTAGRRQQTPSAAKTQASPPANEGTPRSGGTLFGSE